MIPTLFHKRKYLKESIENTCKSLSRHCNFDARNLKKRTNMMEKVTQMIAMLIKAWKKESVSQIDTSRSRNARTEAAVPQQLRLPDGTGQHLSANSL